MCLLILKPAGHDIPAEILENASLIHQDGFGYAVANGDHFETYHTLQWTPTVLDRLKQLTNKTVLVHYRMATHGSVTLENVHPFRMPVDEITHTYVAHNGILMEYQPELTDLTDRSDTRIFIDEMLAQLQPGWWLDEVMLQALEEEIGWSKFVVLWPSGGCVILNENLGEWQDGVWYSNDSAFPRRKVPVLPAKAEVPAHQSQGFYAETGAYFDQTTHEVWCVSCGNDFQSELEAIAFGRVIHDPYFHKHHPRCAVCNKQTQTVFWEFRPTPNFLASTK